jgi:predicted lipoprotein with Yx(FWY)xxD motif
MRRTGIKLFAAGAVLALAMTACSNDDGGGGGSSGDGTEPAANAVVFVEDSGLGQILVDAEGRTLYLFLPDEQGGESTCYDDCEANWPPLGAEGEIAGGDGVDGSLLGTTERDDGSVQVTYDGWPLYYFAADETADDVNGQGVGDVWYVVAPDGEPIQ